MYQTLSREKSTSPLSTKTLQQRVCSSPTEHKKQTKTKRLRRVRSRSEGRGSTIVAFGTQYAGRRKLFVQRETRGREKRDIKFKAGGGKMPQILF